MVLDANRWRQTLKEREWRVRTSRDNYGLSEDVIIREIGGKANTHGGVVEIRREDLDELVQALEEFTSADNLLAQDYVTNPMAGTQYARMGNWYGGPIRLEWDDERGLILTQVLFKEGTAQDFIITEASCRYLVSTQWFFGLAVIPTLPAADPANATTYRMGAISQNPETSGWSGYIEKRERLYQIAEEHTALLNKGVRVLRTRHFGVREGDLDDEGAAIDLPITAIPTLGTTMRINRGERGEDCTQDIDVDKETPTDQIRTEYVEQGGSSVVRTTHSERSLAAPAPSFSSGEIRRTNNDPTVVGNTATIEEVATARDQIRQEFQESSAQSTERTTHTQNAAELTAPTLETGKIKRRINRATEFDQTETTDEIVSARNQIRTEYSETGNQSVVRTSHTQSSFPLGTLTHAAGKLLRRENMATEFGYTRTIDEQVTVKNQTRLEGVDRFDQFTDRELNTEADAPLGDATKGVGFIHQVSNTATESGKTRTIEETTTAYDQEGTEGEGSASRTTTRATHTQNAGTVSGAATPGFVRRYVNRPTEFGLTQTMLETVEALDQVSGDGERSAARTTTRAAHTQNPVAVTAALVAGEIQRSVNRPTEFGRSQTMLETVLAIDQPGDESDATYARTIARTTHTQKTAAFAVAAASVGEIQRVVNRPTEFGRTQAMLEVVTALNQPATEGEGSAARTVTRATNTQNPSVVSGAATPGFVRRYVNRPTEFGLTQTMLETVEALDQVSGDGERSAARTTTRAAHTQNPVAVTAALVSGQIQRSVNRPTEFGRSQTVLETVQALDQAGTEGEGSAARTVTRATNTQNVATVTGVATPGYVRRFVNRPTEFGRSQTMLETVQAHDQMSSDGERSAARTTTRTAHTQNPVAVSPALVSGQIQRSVNRPTEFGRSQTVLETVAAVDQEGTESEATAARTITRDTNTQRTAVRPIATTSAGEIQRVVNRPTEFGRTQALLEVVTAVDQEGDESEATAARTIARTTYTQKAIALPDASASAGEIQRVVNRPTEFGRTQALLEVVNSINQTGTEGEGSAARTVTRATNTQNTSPVSGAATPCFVRRYVNRPTEFGRTQTMLETVEAHDQVGTESEATAARTITRDTNTQNRLVRPSAATSTGQIQRVLNRPTEFGCNQTMLETILAHDQTGVETDSNAARMITRDTNTQRSSTRADAAWSTGTTRRVVNRPTEFGLTQSVLEETDVLNQAGTEGEGSAARTVTRATNTQNSVAVTGAASAGFVRRYVNRPTEFGLTQTMLETVQAHNQTASSTEDNAAQSTVRSLGTQNGAPLGVAAAAVGTVVRHTNRPTEFGLTATEQMIVTAKPQTGTQWEESLGRSVVRTSATQNPIPLVAPAPQVGQTTRRTNVPTEFGRTRTEDVVVTENEQTFSASFDTRFGSTEVFSGTGAKDATVAGIAAAMTSLTTNTLSANRTSTGRLRYSGAKAQRNTWVNIPPSLYGNYDYHVRYWDGTMHREADVYVLFTAGMGTAKHHIVNGSGKVGYKIMASVPGNVTKVHFLHGGKLKMAVRCEALLV